MSKVTVLVSIIEKILLLLTSAEEKNWAGAFIKFQDRCSDTSGDIPASVQIDMLRMYGGMGSFNDLVLYKQGQPMIKENQELDRLRGELFEILNKR